MLPKMDGQGVRPAGVSEHVAFCSLGPGEALNLGLRILGLKG